MLLLLLLIIIVLDSEYLYPFSIIEIPLSIGERPLEESVNLKLKNPPRGQTRCQSL